MSRTHVKSIHEHLIISCDYVNNQVRIVLILKLILRYVRSVSWHVAFWQDCLTFTFNSRNYIIYIFVLFLAMILAQL